MNIRQLNDIVRIKFLRNIGRGNCKFIDIERYVRIIYKRTRNDRKSQNGKSTQRVRSDGALLVFGIEARLHGIGGDVI